MAETKREAAELKSEATRRPWWRLSLTTWILVGLVLGGVLGKVSPAWGNRVYFLRDIFLNLIKSIIAPLVFSTLVVGIAGGGDLKKVGRMGAKALLYFEVVTTAALFIGASVVDAMVRGDVLQIVAFSVLFAMAVSAMGERGRPILRACDSLSQVMFKFTGYVMLFAPVGVGAAMAHTVATQGLSVLKNLGKL